MGGGLGKSRKTVMSICEKREKRRGSHNGGFEGGGGIMYLAKVWHGMAWALFIAFLGEKGGGRQK